jgi:hypothetical protein
VNTPPKDDPLADDNEKDWEVDPDADNEAFYE